MMPRRSMALQLAVGLSAMTALLWTGAAAIATIGIQHAVNEAYDYAMRQAANRLLPVVLHDLREPWERQRPEGNHDEEGDFRFVVRDRAGAVVVNDGNVPPAPVAQAGSSGYFGTDLGRAYATTDRRTGYGIVVFEAETERQEAINEALVGLVLPLVALLPLVAAGVWFALRLALRPLERLRAAIAERDRHNLEPFEASDHPRELAPIAEEVANLLERLRDALDAERAFAATSAHQLRTPIAGALAQTQLLAAELAGQPGAQRTADIERALRKLGALAERLLQLSRLEAGFARSEVSSDLVPVVSLIVQDFQRGGLTIEYHVPDGARLEGRINPDAFALAVTNLIENASRHGAKDKAVGVTIGPGAALTVSNRGQVVPPDLLSSLGRPFVRGATTADGTGLGLSIVRSIMQQVGGTLTLKSPQSGAQDGLEARLAFPEDAHQRPEPASQKAMAASSPSMKGTPNSRDNSDFRPA